MFDFIDRSYDPRSCHAKLSYLNPFEIEARITSAYPASHEIDNRPDVISVKF